MLVNQSKVNKNLSLPWAWHSSAPACFYIFSARYLSLKERKRIRAILWKNEPRRTSALHMIWWHSANRDVLPGWFQPYVSYISAISQSYLWHILNLMQIVCESLVYLMHTSDISQVYIREIFSICQIEQKYFRNISGLYEAYFIYVSEMFRKYMYLWHPIEYKR